MEKLTTHRLRSTGKGKEGARRRVVANSRKRGLNSAAVSPSLMHSSPRGFLWL